MLTRYSRLVSHSRIFNIFYILLILLFSEDKDSDGKEKKSKSKEKDKKKEPASMFQISGDKDSKSKKKGDYILIDYHNSKNYGLPFSKPSHLS